jgi:uncharacterized membrane protein YkvI
MRHDALAAASVYVGAVVGAGFATGREVLHFFAAYGSAGLWGCLAAGAAFGWLGSRILRLAATGAAPDYARLYRVALGRAARPADWSTTACLFVGLSVVLAGGAALGSETWGLSPATGALLLALLIAAVLLPGRSGLVWANVALVPLLAAAALVLLVAEAAAPGFWHSVLAAAPAPGRPPAGWPLGAVLYVGYNILLGAVALCAVGDGMSPRAAARAGALGGLGLGVLAAGVAAPLLAHLPEVAASPVPLLRVVESHGSVWRAAYAGCLGGALLTTGVATAYALAGRLRLRALPPGLVAAGAVFLALPLAAAGIVALVATVYPAMGALGLLLCAGLARAPVAKDYRG